MITVKAFNFMRVPTERVKRGYIQDQKEIDICLNCDLKVCKIDQCKRYREELKKLRS